MTGVIYRIRTRLNSTNIKLIYSSLIYPNLLYCSAIWGGAYQTYMQNLFLKQKKMIRVMFNCSRYDHTNPYFRDHNLLKLPDIITLQTCLFTYNSLNIFAINTGFELITHNIGTRRVQELRIPLYRTSHVQQSVLFRGTRQWNNLPDETKLAPSKSSFKLRLKRLLLRSHCNS